MIETLWSELAGSKWQKGAQNGQTTIQVGISARFCHVDASSLNTNPIFSTGLAHSFWTDCIRLTMWTATAKTNWRRTKPKWTGMSEWFFMSRYLYRSQPWKPPLSMTAEPFYANLAVQILTYVASLVCEILEMLFCKNGENHCPQQFWRLNGWESYRYMDCLRASWLVDSNLPSYHQPE